MTGKAARDRLERRYARLLRLYPKDYRESYGAELIDTLLAARRPPVAESLNLIGGAVIARARRVHLPARAPWQDALAITSLLAPILLLAGVGESMRPPSWATFADPPSRAAVADLIALAWPIVLVLGLFRVRRTAMVGCWLLTVATVVALNVPGSPATSEIAGWSVLAVLGAVAGTISAGVRRGYELVGRGRTVLVGAAVLLVLLGRVAGHYAALTHRENTLVHWGTLGVALGCVGYAAWRGGSTGPRVAVLFAAPVAALVAKVVRDRAEPLRALHFGSVLPQAEAQYVPALAVLVLIGLAAAGTALVTRGKPEAAGVNGPDRTDADPD